ncbi:hypothetical protein PVAP13_3KG392954 [Panicum virgatum]|uniref:Uncharacterized protein n=1 Tax=Panicum virgatum TaxID=38727 RepID=A0A8T0UW07_PANVG|nr:hypothetical protein PVAP13_3KG392954 [Panicum virgatum]
MPLHVSDMSNGTGPSYWHQVQDPGRMLVRFIVQTNITNGLVSPSLYFAEVKNKGLLISATLSSLKL